MRHAIAATFAFLTACGASAEATPPADGRPTFEVEVRPDGYHPAEITAPPSTAIHVVFTRTSDEGCGQQVVFPDLNLRRDLPLDTPVSVDVTTPADGRIEFACGMGMLHGAVVAR